MPSVDLRDVGGARTGSVALDDAVFGIQPNVPVLHQVVTAQLAAARSGTQSTKTRAEVSGGGRKPFKQKGTGRARQGSERAPHFAGGGVALGPKPRSYKQRTPRKMIQLALRSALSDRAADGKVAVVEGWPWEIPSTKDALGALSALGLDGKVLVVLSREDEEAYKSFRNLPEVQLILAGELNAYDILCNDWVLFTRETLPGDSPIDQSASPSPTAAPSGTAVPGSETAVPASETAVAASETAVAASETALAASETAAAASETAVAPEATGAPAGTTESSPASIETAAADSETGAAETEPAVATTDDGPAGPGPTGSGPTGEEDGDE